MTVTEDIRYIGVNDHDIDLFEAQYTVPEGMSYNSYVILDEKVAVMDTVDGRFGGEWLGNLEKELSGRTPDYLVVQHMEPDHSANIAVFAEKYPSAKIVASKQACEDANYLQSPISISRKISFVFKVRRMDILPIQLRNRGLFFKIEKF